MPAYRIELKEVFKKRQVSAEHSNTIELINDGIRKHGEKYVGTFDQFWFNLSEPFRIFLKTSYDELVKLWDWQNEVSLEKLDFDNTMLFGEKIGKKSLWQKKKIHIKSAPMTIYLSGSEEKTLGPPSTHPGPDGELFGDLRSIRI